MCHGLPLPVQTGEHFTQVCDACSWRVRARLTKAVLVFNPIHLLLLACFSESSLLWCERVVEQPPGFRVAHTCLVGSAVDILDSFAVMLEGGFHLVIVWYFSVPKCVILRMSLRHAPHAGGDDPIKDLGFVVFPTLVGIVAGVFSPAFFITSSDGRPAGTPARFSCAAGGIGRCRRSGCSRRW